MILLIILSVVFLSVFAIVMVVNSHIKKTEKQKYYAAAGNIMREDYLNYSLQNTIDSRSNIEEPKNAKMMVYLKTKSEGKKKQYVFDPEKIIKIGRDSSQSNILINDARVSQNHCIIYSSENTVYLQDVGSANGTIVSRGLRKKYLLSGGRMIVLRTGDTIRVGASSFKVCLFYYDLAKV